MDQEYEPKMSSFFDRYGRLLIAGAVLLAAMFYFGFLAFQGATVYYVTVGEVLDHDGGINGETVRVNGNLVPGSFERDPSSTIAQFTLVDPASGQEMHAIFDGLVPDLFFNPHSQIVVEGEFGSNGYFEATNVIVKCPSKYVSEGEIV